MRLITRLNFGIFTSLLSGLGPPLANLISASRSSIHFFCSCFWATFQSPTLSASHRSNLSSRRRPISLNQYEYCHLERCRSVSANLCTSASSSISRIMLKTRSGPCKNSQVFHILDGTNR
ncbi:hypothetical protein F4801DRAFT_526851 [Xylaria longipes]|nr:hypothetical protein F4801DRAFT_526851 [Xylaria longipes]